MHKTCTIDGTSTTGEEIMLLWDVMVLHTKSEAIGSGRNCANDEKFEEEN
jgi:hypothetical protein